MRLTAPTIHALCRKLSDSWYESVEGVYDNVPTWGEETEAVKSLIGRSCSDGDIVSWDTRSNDPQAHLYLMRKWHPCRQTFEPENTFDVKTHAEMVAARYFEAAQ